MAELQDVFRRVDEALARGQVWRAKEILRGNIGQRPYDPELYRRYGRLLLKLGDLPEAGKYLFLSCDRSEDCSEAIDVYLDRFGRHGLGALYSTFPSRARLSRRSDYPEPLRSELTKLLFPEKLRQLSDSAPQPAGCGARVKDWGCAIGFVILAGLVLVGLMTVLSWLG